MSDKFKLDPAKTVAFQTDASNPTVLRATDPRADPDHVEQRLEAVGYGVYLFGVHLYCRGLQLPVFLPEFNINATLTNAECINNQIYPDLAAALKDLPASTPAPGYPVWYAYYRGAGGALIVPTVFSPATTPRTMETIQEAVRLFKEDGQRRLAGVALSLAGTVIVKAVATGIMRALDGKNLRGTRLPAPNRVRPVNGRVNVGGGLEPGAEAATNLNPIVSGTGGPTKDIANHIKAGFEQIDEVIEPGSAKEIISNRLPFKTVDWPRSAQGAYKVMAPGGSLSLNVWAQTPQEVQVILDAFIKAGFRDVKASGSGTATIISGIR